MADKSCTSESRWSFFRDHIKHKLIRPHITRQSWLRVEWEREPQAWMLSAAVAFDAALHMCNPPDEFDTSEEIVVHVNFFKESDRPANCTGRSLPPPEANKQELIAKPMVRLVTAKPVLWTGLGQWMNSHGLLTWTIVGVICVLAVLFMVNPGVTVFYVADTVSHNKEHVRVAKPDAYVLLLQLVLFSFGLFFLAHMISQDVLRLVIGFDAAVTTIATAIAQFVHVHELITNYSVANKLLPIMDIILIAVRNCMIVMVFFLGSVMDAWTTTRKTKIVVLIAFLSAIIFNYWSFSLSLWSKRQTCFLGQCTTMKSLYLGSLKTFIVFAMKLLLPYVKGHSYALLRFRAIDLATELHQRHQESITWKCSRALQDSAPVRDDTGSQCTFKSVTFCSHDSQRREDGIDDQQGIVMLGRDLQELDEAGWDGDCPHQLPRPSEGGHVALGWEYFEYPRATWPSRSTGDLGT